MSKFTNTLIATAVAAVLAAPAIADVPTGPLGAYTGSKTTADIKPSGCSNAKEKDLDTVVGFGDVEDGFIEFFPGAACWSTNIFLFNDEASLRGLEVTRSTDKKTLEAKEVTMSLTGSSLHDVLDEMADYLDSTDAAKCEWDGDENDLEDNAYVKKGRGKFSKNQEKLNVEMEVETQYTGKKDKLKKITARIKGKLDFDATKPNPAFDCGLVFVDPQA